MRKLELKTYPAKTHSEVTEITCDLCGAISGMGGPHRSSWDCSSFEVNITRVEHEVGSSYPEGGNTEKTFIDICPKCFDGKLVPWLNSLGVEPQKESRDW